MSMNKKIIGSILVSVGLFLSSFSARAEDHSKGNQIEARKNALVHLLLPDVNAALQGLSKEFWLSYRSHLSPDEMEKILASEKVKEDEGDNDGAICPVGHEWGRDPGLVCLEIRTSQILSFIRGESVPHRPPIRRNTITSQMIICPSTDEGESCLWVPFSNLSFSANSVKPNLLTEQGSGKFVFQAGLLDKIDELAR